MEFVTQSGLDVKKSVLITGVTNTKVDNEVIDCLRSYGNLSRVLYVNDPKSALHKNLIIEFADENSYAALEPLLPRTHTSADDELEFRLTPLASECVATADSNSSPPDYLAELKKIADRSGCDFDNVLKSVMTQIGHHLDSAAAKNITLKHEDDYEDDDDEDSDDDEEEARGVDTGSEQPQPAPPFQQEALSRQPRARQRTSLSPDQLNPPEVQKVVVEHVVRNTDLLSSFPRLRPFSGKTPKQSNEADYDSWRGQIALLLTDPSLSALQVTRRIMESLLSPAADLVKGLNPDTLPAVFLIYHPFHRLGSDRWERLSRF